MTDSVPNPETDALRKRVAQLERINAALTKRVERTVDESGSAYAIFEQNITMQQVIRERTTELANANNTLKAEIRERQIAVEAMRDALTQAEAASAAKSQFLANMSHEIRTPMTAIMGFLDLLDPCSESTLSETERHQAFATVLANANHLLKVIDEVLDVSKIEADQMITERIPTDAVAIIREVAELMDAHAAEKGIELIVRFETPMPVSIRSDPTRLRQVLCNLAGNAIKFTEQGSVTLSAACDPDEQRLTVRVEDTGIGMTRVQLGTVRTFSAFTQADESMTRRFGGTGLGLRISSALLERMGGTLTVESAHGRGSVFTAIIATGQLCPESMRNTVGCIPHVQQKHESAEKNVAHDAVPPIAEKPLAGETILLVEDGIDNRRLIGFLIRKAGAEVIEAENGQVAVDLIDSGDATPALILMDMQMPILDGYSATAALRERGVTLPILALTAHAMSGDREKCLAAGCDGYLTKPIDKHSLITECAVMINGHTQNKRAA